MIRMTEREIDVMRAIVALCEAGENEEFLLNALIDLLYPNGARRGKCCRQTIISCLRNLQWKFELCGIRMDRTSPLGRGNVAVYKVQHGLERIKNTLVARKWQVETKTQRAA